MDWVELASSEYPTVFWTLLVVALLFPIGLTVGAAMLIRHFDTKNNMRKFPRIPSKIDSDPRGEPECHEESSLSDSAVPVNSSSESQKEKSEKDSKVAFGMSPPAISSMADKKNPRKRGLRRRRPESSKEDFETIEPSSSVSISSVQENMSNTSSDPSDSSVVTKEKPEYQSRKSDAKTTTMIVCSFTRHMFLSLFFSLQVRRMEIFLSLSFLLCIIL